MSNKRKKWIRYLWLKGCTMKTIREIYAISSPAIVRILRMPDNWESMVA